MNPGIAIGLIVFGLPLLAVLIGIAIGSHFGKDPLDEWAERVGLSSGSEDPHP